MPVLLINSAGGSFVPLLLMQLVGLAIFSVYA